MTVGETKLNEMRPSIEDKAKQLSDELKSEVTPFAFIVNDDLVIGYLQEPDRAAKMQAIDMYERSRSQAGDIILRSGLIQSESDSRILSELKVNDAIYLGAIDFAVNSVKMYAEQLKKK